MIIWEILFILLAAAGMWAVFNPEVPTGVLRCVLTPIGAGSCRTGNAGISEVYLIPYDDIDAITWTSDVASAITLVATKTWTAFKFERDTAFWNQEKQANGQNLNWVQTLSMNFTNNDSATRAALKALDGCCDLVALVVDNQGQQHLAGVLPRGTGSRSLGLKTGAGSFNSGANPSADQLLHVVTLTANSAYQAPYTTVDVTALALTP